LSYLLSHSLLPSTRHEVRKENIRKFSDFQSSLVISHLFIQQHDLYSEWRPFYIDYNLLKRELKVLIFSHNLLLHPAHTSLKARTTSHNWNATDEEEFTSMLEGELDKIHDFQKAKVHIVTMPPHPFLKSPMSHSDRRAVKSYQDC
jgi:hypothetical protein